MLEDAQPRVLVTQEELLNNIDGAFRTVCLDSHSQEIASQPIALPSPIAGPENLAYVMYTSGSTGKPKGVQIEHRAVVNLVTSMAREPGIKPEDHLLASSTLSFDMSTLEMFLPLTNGARMTVICKRDSHGRLTPRRYHGGSGITVFQATPATWRLLLAAGWKGKDDLKILIGGEAVPQDLIQSLMPRCASLWHMYGPTETTVWSTACHLTSATEKITIGRPIANTQIYILDKHLSRCPLACPAICLLGVMALQEGITTGRIDSRAFSTLIHLCETLTNRRKIYKTGDRARYLEDGRLIFLGT